MGEQSTTGLPNTQPSNWEADTLPLSYCTLKLIQLIWKSQMWIACYKSYYFFEQRAFKHYFAFVLMQMCACLKEHMGEVIDYVFTVLCSAWFTHTALLAGITKTATGKACKKYKDRWKRPLDLLIMPVTLTKSMNHYRHQKEAQRKAPKSVYHYW